MADATGKKLLGLLAAKQAGPVRRAAVLVLGEIGAKDDDLTDAMCELLQDADEELRIAATEAVGKLHIDRALPDLVEKINAGGRESEAAAQAAAKLGAKGIRTLQEMMPKVAPGLRRRIAAALAAGGTSRSESAAIETLLDSDPGVVDAATRTLISEVRALGQAQRRALAEHTIDLLKPKKGATLPVHSEAALLRLLASLDDPRAEAVFWSRIDGPQPAELRSAALQALGAAKLSTSAATLKRLLSCATDREFRVVAPALMMLKEMPVNAKTLPEWLVLLKAPDLAVRRFAIEKLAAHDTRELADALVAQLPHPDRGLRDQALAALAKLEHGHEALAAQLLEATTPEQAWQLARAQGALVKNYARALRTKLQTKAFAYLDKDDRRADAFLSALREADVKELNDALSEKALALRKKKQYPAALVYLRLLGRDPTIGEGIRFELAACGLKVSSHDLAAAARTADPSLQQFAKLIHSHDNDPLVYIRKASWLEPEDLFYLGFHFVEGNGAERDFGGGVLKLVLQKAGRTKLAKDAKAKLKGAGID